MGGKKCSAGEGGWREIWGWRGHGGGGWGGGLEGTRLEGYLRVLQGGRGQVSIKRRCSR